MDVLEARGAEDVVDPRLVALEVLLVALGQALVRQARRRVEIACEEELAGTELGREEEAADPRREALRVADRGRSRSIYTDQAQRQAIPSEIGAQSAARQGGQLVIVGGGLPGRHGDGIRRRAVLEEEETHARVGAEVPEALVGREGVGKLGSVAALNLREDGDVRPLAGQEPVDQVGLGGGSVAQAADVERHDAQPGRRGALTTVRKGPGCARWGRGSAARSGYTRSRAQRGRSCARARLRGACGVGAGGESVLGWASLLRAPASACASVCG